MKSRDGKSQRREEKRRDERRREEKRREEKKREEKRREEKKREEKRREEENKKKRKSQKKEDPGARKGRKVAKDCGFSMICGSGGSKSRLAKAAGAEPAGQMRDEKVHAVVAQNAFPSQNVQSAPCSDHFWELRCLKSARRCGAKQCWKHRGFGPLLDVHMCFRAASARDCGPFQKLASVRVLWHFQKGWQAWGIWRGSAKMHFPWQAQYKRLVYQRC